VATPADVPCGSPTPVRAGGPPGATPLARLTQPRHATRRGSPRAWEAHCPPSRSGCPHVSPPPHKTGISSRPPHPLSLEHMFDSMEPARGDVMADGTERNGVVTQPGTALSSVEQAIADFLGLPAVEDWPSRR